MCDLLTLDASIQSCRSALDLAERKRDSETYNKLLLRLRELLLEREQFSCMTFTSYGLG